MNVGYNEVKCGFLQRFGMALFFLATMFSAWGSPGGGAASLDKLIEDADIIFKGTVVSSTAVEATLFEGKSQFDVRETQFRVVSFIKGASADSELSFRHYVQLPSGSLLFDQMHSYNFSKDRTYIVLGKKTNTEGVFQQLRSYDIVKVDHDVILCSDSLPSSLPTPREAIWSELNTLLGSTDPGNAVYAINQLDEMSMGRLQPLGTTDFDRGEVLTSVFNLVASKNPEVAKAAITLVGEHNPYLTKDRTNRWLITVASSEIPGIAKLDRPIQNPGGKKYWRELAKVANGDGHDESRAMAIRALGFVSKPEIEREIEGWLSDNEPEVRAAATLLLSDYPDSEGFRKLRELASDVAPVVRAAAATTVGISQDHSRLDLLDALLNEEETLVRLHAARSLLSFSPRDAGVAKILSAHMRDGDYWPSFMLALATDNPTPYLEDLAQVIEDKPKSEFRLGGEVLAFQAWHILFDYVQGLSDTEIESKKANRYFDALEQLGTFSSTPIRDLYAFYVRHGFVERASEFRALISSQNRGALEEFFERVDANSAYHS